MKRILLVLFFLPFLYATSFAQDDSLLLWETEDAAEERNIVVDGDGGLWKSFEVDDMVVALNVRYFRNFGRYFLVDMYIFNGTGHPVLFDFAKTSIDSDTGSKVRVFSYEQFINRAKSRRFWATFGTSMAVFVGALVLDEAFNGSYFRGDAEEYSIGRDIAHDLSSFFIQESAAIGSMLIGDHFSRDLGNVIHENVGYIGTYKIQPQYAIKGHFFARYKKGTKSLRINLPIGGRVYSFGWDTGNLERVE